MSSKLSTELIPVDSIFENPANARIHPDRQLDVICASLRRFGQQTPIVVGSDKLIIKGNGTFQAAKKLGWTDIEVVWSKLNFTEAKAYGIVDNQSGELSEWDLNLLGSNLQELYKEDPTQDWDAVGFEKEELIPMLGDLSEEELNFLGVDSKATKPETKDDLEMGKPIKVTKEQRSVIDRAIFKLRYDEGDPNISEGRCLEFICEEWIQDPNHDAPRRS